MSRRQSRVSADTRQNDTLLEFENFKKKFLLANKHITKLNSTLSVRIEELNAQISTLYVENLRLRASEIALATQLKKEREKSRKVMADAEGAIHNFVKHLGYIRKSHNIPHGRSSSPEAQPQPRARRPAPNPETSPQMNKIARAPNFPNIHEDDEANVSSPENLEPEADAEEDEVDEPSPTPVRKKTKPRSSSSRLPLPTRTSSPPPIPTIDAPAINFDEQLTKAGKRKPTRRQSGLLTTSMSITVTERPPSPAFGSPLRREAALEEEEEEVMAVIGIDREDEEPELITQSVVRREKKKRMKEKEKEVLAAEMERGSSSESAKREEKRKRTRESEGQATAVVEGSTRKSKLKDVTNSTPSLTPLDTALSDRERHSTPETADAPPSATSTTTTSSIMTSRTFLTTPATTPAPSLKGEPHHLPTPRSSSPIPPSEVSDSEQQAATGGRERRTRKSVNYTEPKLNTKMRKPEGFVSSIKRPSVSGSDTHSGPRTSGEFSTANEPQLPEEPLPGATVRRKKSRAYVLPEDGEESEGTQADAEYGGGRSAGGGPSAGWAGSEGRRRSAQGSGSRSKMLEGDDGRRHSMAV
ncbi:hypothetical protein EIP91_004454 [Steccherinum ochraceum]|uniref:Shugoshin C-terminal domain-containing protein n=1 Tax=Steccherinum ochraceum TaxID=92696 RepID=A0A4R0R8S8_9APHY|nr:hypothetical protein EIP91_004454 [Steccherinum ochraceum]